MQLKVRTYQSEKEEPIQSIWNRRVDDVRACFYAYTVGNFWVKE